jgi:hypothetical protein
VQVLGLICHRRVGRRRRRQHDAEEGAVRGFVALVPDLAAMAIDDVAQGQRTGFVADVHRLELPGVERLRGHRGTRPDQVHEDHLAVGCQAQPQFADLVVVLQAGSQER